MEALSRGFYKGEIISPLELLEYASLTERNIELDRIFRKKAVQSFQNTAQLHKNLLLFINIEVTELDKVVGSQKIMKLIKESGLTPERIVLEINENKAGNFKALKKFVDFYRKNNFLIALDDVGKGFSNFDRIFSLMPDLIKIDHSLVNEIHQDYYKQEIYKALSSLARKTGTKIIAEGVESKDELWFLLKAGADMIQGYFFSFPERATLWKKCMHQDKIKKISRIYKNSMKEKIKEDFAHEKKYLPIMKKFIKKLQQIKDKKIDFRLHELIEIFSGIEAVYILNLQGVQISKTVLKKTEMSRNKFLFHPASPGTDHSYKKYFYYLKETECEEYITSSYVSQATGNLCITVSKYFYNLNGNRFILCVDFQVNG